jgi:D-alanyl-D-alanine carboxypeptidase/D-alanyl-D-alanine-endopeptidase (penicillin-binding protein 4)
MTMLKLAALSSLLLTTTTLASGPSEADLSASLENAVTSSVALAPASLGVHVRELGTGRTVFDHDAETPMIPASILKLFTTGAAAVTLGPDHSFSTTLALADDDLIITGTGDPGLGDPALLEEASPPRTIEDLLASITNAVIAQGVTEIDEIIVDDRVFDREYVHPSWSRDQLNRWYSAEVAGVNFHTNCITFDVRPADAGPGVAPTVELVPDAPWIEWSNRGKTVASGRTTAWVARPTPANRYTLFGNVHRRSSALIDVTLHEPQLFFAQVIADRLARAGVAVGGATDPARAITRARLVAAGESLPEQRPLVIVRTAMHDALRRANVNSQNMYTEALIKAAGHAVSGEPGSWSNGAAVVRMIVAERLGPQHARGLQVADGSGLSRNNRVTAAGTTAWLRSCITDETIGRVFLDSLPGPGEGTLRSRFGGSSLSSIVRAKSGSISGVRCMSGVVTSPRSGRAYAFSVLANDLSSTASIRAARDLHEEVVEIIDEWLVETDAAGHADPAASYGG